MSQTRVRRDGCIRVPTEIMDALQIYPESKIDISRDGDAIVIRKVALDDNPFAAAAKGPDADKLDLIQHQQKDQKEKARDRFEELLKNPPEVKPEDNPDLWR